MWRYRFLQFKQKLESFSIPIGNKQVSGITLFWVVIAALGLYTLKFEWILQIVSLLVAIILHEVAHGWVANKLGDPTAKTLGRLSLNPIKHLDPVGSFILPGILILSGSGVVFGWAKPVPVQSRFFKNESQGMMWVAIAGPLTNIAIAWVCALLISVLGPESTVFNVYLSYFLSMSILINVVLALFNCMPIPPLDGSRVLSYFLPTRGQQQLVRLEPYGFLIVFFFLYIGVFDLIVRVFAPPIIKFLLPGAL